MSHGIVFVLHSATKYLGGHSDLIAGALVIGKKDEELIARMANIVNSLGPVTGAFDSYLILRSLKTLAVRMERHCENALAIAQHFENHKEISEVIYPGLTNHPQHELAAKQMNGFGGIISMNIKGGLEKSKRFLEQTKIFALAESLGGVESLIEHPALMTHASLPKDRREAIGISDGLVRLSVGIESLDDLIEGATDPYGFGWTGYEWGCFGENTDGANGTSSLTGYQNTLDIAIQCSTENGGTTSAQEALAYESESYNDWYLPSKEELVEMYMTIGQGSSNGNIGGFINEFYWSSSENDDFKSWGVNFGYGFNFYTDKYLTARVRVIRAF